MKNNKGFSLVELIIVIAIMAILVGVIAPQLILYIEKSRAQELSAKRWADSMWSIPLTSDTGSVFVFTKSQKSVSKTLQTHWTTTN